MWALPFAKRLKYTTSEIDNFFEVTNEMLRYDLFFE